MCFFNKQRLRYVMQKELKTWPGELSETKPAKCQLHYWQFLKGQQLVSEMQQMRPTKENISHTWKYFKIFNIKLTFFYKSIAFHCY